MVDFGQLSYLGLCWVYWGAQIGRDLKFPKMRLAAGRRCPAPVGDSGGGTEAVGRGWQITCRVHWVSLTAQSGSLPDPEKVIKDVFGAS
jgi:hypothetical protein